MGCMLHSIFAFLRCGEFTRNSWQSYSRSVLSLGDVLFDHREDPKVPHLTLHQSKTDIFGVGLLIHLGLTGD